MLFSRRPISRRTTCLHRKKRRRRFEPLEPRRLLAADPIISEFMASNTGTILDGDGNSSDWIELFNAGDAPVDLEGWFLTDDAANLNKWAFPPLELSPGEFQLVFASGQSVDDYVDPAGYLHATFKLSAQGEYLALVRPDGETVQSGFPPAFSQQFIDTSYGVGMNAGNQTLIGESAAVQTIIPTDDGLGLAWTEPDFTPDGAWITESSPGVPATTGVGFDSDLANPNLMGHWALDEPAGTTGTGSIVDRVYGNHGTPNIAAATPNGVEFEQAGATGNTGTSADFIGGKISVPRDDALNGASFTFAAWAYADAAGGGGGNYRTVVTSRRGAAGAQEGYILYNTNGGDWSFWTGYNNGLGTAGSWNQLSGGPVTTGAWTHLAISYDAATGTKSIYVNGVLANSSVTTQYTPNTNGGGLHLGAGADDGSAYRFDGKLDDAAVWDTALGLADVQSVMSAGAASVTAGQVAHWRLDEPAGTGGFGSAVDSAGGGHDGSLPRSTAFALGADGATAATDTSASFVNASIDVPYSPQLNPSSFTVTAWARPYSTGGHQSLITSRDNAAGNITYGYILYNYAGNWEFWTGNDAIGWPTTRATGAVRLNEWQHLAISYDEAANTKSLYVNGVLAASSTDPDTPLYAPNAVEPLHIGGGSDDGLQFRFDGDVDDVAVFDTALDEAAIARIMADGTPPVGADVADLIGTDVGTAMAGANASAYLRIPFEVADPSGINGLQLLMTYDDGFVAYLNGRPVAARNAPAVLDWNSTAVEPRPAYSARDEETVDLTEFAGDLRAGTNVLAIHGLNASPDDAEFLILPRLEAFSIEVVPAELGYFTTPTPGGPNDAAAGEIGPLITDVSHTPQIPGAADDVVVAATIAETSYPVSGATLYYRAMYGVEVPVAMLDDGAAPDAVAGDGVFTGAIPSDGTTVGGAAAGEMLRYYVTSADTEGNGLRAPLFFDPTAPEYFGTVVADPTVDTVLPVLNWFVPDPAWHKSGTGNNKDWSTASAFFGGQFYDNMMVRVRGQSVRNWAKPKLKFETASGQDFRYRPEERAVEEFNLQSHYSDNSYMRETLAFEWLREIGTPAPIAFHVQVRQNGEFYSLASFIEQIDDTFLRRNGFDDDGALYKSFSPRAQGTLLPNPTTADYRKVNRKDEPWDDLRQFTDGLGNLLPGVDRSTYIFDAVNLPEVINEMAGQVIMPNHDRLTKNYYVYRDSDGNGQWSRFPWDTEASFRIQNAHFASVLYGDSEHTQGTQNQVMYTNHLIDAILDTPVTREMYLRRVRTLMDEYLGAESGYFEERADALLARIEPDAALDGAKWGMASAASGVAGLKSNVAYRRAELAAEPLIPPSDLPGVTYSTLLDETDAAAAIVPDAAFDAAFGMDWIGLPANEPWDESGWMPGSGGVGYDNNGDYPIGIDVDATMDGINTSVYARYTFDVADPAAFDSLTLRMRYDDGFVAYLNGAEIRRENFTGTPAWNSLSDGIADESAEFVEYDVGTTGLSQLRTGTNVLAVHGLNRNATSSDMLILPRLLGGVADAGGTALPEIDFGVIEFNPDSGNQNQEYVELVNGGDVSVDISGWQLTGGIEFTFQPGTVIPANFTMYVSPDVTAFRARTNGPAGGQALFVQGDYSGHISNAGEAIELADDDGAIIASVVTETALSPAQAFLRISEVMYNPPAVTQAEIDAGFTDNDDFEFLELVNTSETETLVLDGVSFTRGITYQFADADPNVDETALGPGERVLVVRDVAAFIERYGTAGMNVAGEYRVPDAAANRLNNDGETIKLEDAGNSTIQEFAYNDSVNRGWPVSPDGEGRSLEAVSFDDGAADPATWNDYGDSALWYAAPQWGGSPGAAATAAVIERLVFYDGSAFDTVDDDAVAADKRALLPGQTATASNYTNYTGGINGLIIDVAWPGDRAALGDGDFTLLAGNDGDPNSWTPAAAPVVTVRPGEGRGGSDRVVFTWPIDAPTNTWLQVTTRSDMPNTGLPADDVFYFGNAVGDVHTAALGAGLPGAALVNAADVIAIRDNPRGGSNPAAMDDPHDVNRDMRIDAVDMILARNNAAGPLSALRLITP